MPDHSSHPTDATPAAPKERRRNGIMSDHRRGMFAKNAPDDGAP